MDHGDDLEALFSFPSGGGHLHRVAAERDADEMRWHLVERVAAQMDEAADPELVVKLGSLAARLLKDVSELKLKAKEEESEDSKGGDAVATLQKLRAKREAAGKPGAKAGRAKEKPKSSG